MSLSTTSKWLLNTIRDGDSTTLSGSLFQCLTTLSVKKFFLISNVNFPWCNLRPFPLVQSPVTSEINSAHTVITFQALEESSKVSPQPPLPLTKQLQFLQSLLVGHILQALHKPCCPSSAIVLPSDLVILLGISLSGTYLIFSTDISISKYYFNWKIIASHTEIVTNTFARVRSTSQLFWQLRTQVLQKLKYLPPLLAHTDLSLLGVLNILERKK